MFPYDLSHRRGFNEMAREKKQSLPRLSLGDVKGFTDKQEIAAYLLGADRRQNHPAFFAQPFAK